MTLPEIIMLIVIVVCVGGALFFGARTVYIRGYQSGAKDGMKATMLGLMQQGLMKVPSGATPERAAMEEHVKTCPDGESCGIKQFLAAENAVQSVTSLDGIKTGQYL